MNPRTGKFIRYTEFVVFDLETNGLNPFRDSVVSCGAVRCKAEVYDDAVSVRKTDVFERYYYPVEQYNPVAVRVHQLTDERIKELREDVEYPEYFRDDDGLMDFCNGIRRFVAHNVFSDVQFVNFRLPAIFCTMRNNSGILRHKTNPSLLETASYYEIPIDKRRLHNSLYDATLTMKVFEEMLSLENPAAIRFLR